MMITRQKSNQMRGFSINEVMISMFIVSVGLLTVIGLFSSGFLNSQLDRDRITASGLAQEGAELVKNVRDNDLVIGGNGFTNFPVLNSFPTANHCQLDYNDTVFTCYPNVNNPEQKFPLALVGEYYVSANTAQKFSRYISIAYSSANATADVISIVYWNPNWSTDINISNTIDPGFMNGNNVVLANCTSAKKCVYSQLRLEAWKP